MVRKQFGQNFKESESSDASNLSAWYDVRESVNKNNATQSNSSNYPTYSNSINHIQAVKFDGTNGYLTADGSVLNNTNYTIFVLEQRESNKSDNYFIGDSTSGNESITNANLVLGYSADGAIKHSQSSDNSYTALISSYGASSGKPRIFTFVHDKEVGKKIYINGILAATSTDTNSLSGMTSLKIGSAYQGQIGEVAIFARALSAEERQSIEDYLGKKWNSPILRSAGSSAASGGIGGSCVGGVVGTDSCLTACTVPTTTGITDTTVAGGSSSLTCNTAANFTGSLPYTCLNGTFSYTSNTSCFCADGYSESGSVCNPINPSCSGGIEDITSMPGYKIHVFNSSGTLTCTAGGTIQSLVVGAGGGGARGGGGGAGGVVYNASASILAQTYSVTVGQGISQSTGQDSSFNGVTAKGGGAQCGVGGSGGGGGYGCGAAGLGTSGQGNNGASCDATDSCGLAGGGGGGAGSAGQLATGGGTIGGAGGSGVNYGSIFSTNYGENGWFASGAGGMPSGAASDGGGSDGSGGSGAANTGGGGASEASGGSGIVIIRYAR